MAKDRIPAAGRAAAAAAMIAAAALGLPSLQPSVPSALSGAASTQAAPSPAAVQGPGSIPLKPARLAAADELACAGCHAQVVSEWAASAHAISWVDELYQKALAEKQKPELCWSCHVPRPLVESGALAKVAARDETVEPKLHGISCSSCHLGPDGAWLGEAGTPTSAHATAASPLLSESGASALCSACHSTNIGPVVGVAKDFAAAGLAAEGKSCVGCHMPAIERPVAPGEPGGTATGTLEGRSHAIMTPRDPAFLARAFELGLRPAGDPAGAGVVVQNKAGHRVPGLIGRTITFTAEALDEAGNVLATGSFTLDTKSYLPVGAAQAIPLQQLGARVRVRATMIDPRGSGPLQFLEQELAPAGR